MLKHLSRSEQYQLIEASHNTLGSYWLYYENPQGTLFTENESNLKRLFDVDNKSPYTKDGIHDFIIHGDPRVNPEMVGTKAAPHYVLSLDPGVATVVKLRLVDRGDIQDPFGSQFTQIVHDRLREADEFYAKISSATDPDQQRVQRQAWAGMLWTKQYYHYVIDEWLKGDPVGPPPPDERKRGRNSDWIHVFNDDVLSMPDKWEYPWFAAWDLAFHAVPLAMVDPEFAKRQLDLMTREWYMHPNGQLPAYEWAFEDVNPPVHAWATYRVYQLEQKLYGRQDRLFLERVFQKLLMNFTWWVNRKDEQGNNVFEGGFLGLDNIGVFNRSEPLPTGGFTEQADGTSWMAMYALNLMTIALELAVENPAYEDIASKFFEHFLYIADAMNRVGDGSAQLWNEEEGFYYDVLNLPHHEQIQLKVRSMVGLLPLCAVVTLEPSTLERLPGFNRRVQWFLNNRPDLTNNVACMRQQGSGERRLLAITYREKLERILARLLDESEFLSNYGIRALSRFHLDHPYIFNVDGYDYRVDYEPGESTSPLFGGNSNWRGPIWMPVNYLLIESLRTFYTYYGDDFKVDYPTGSGTLMTLQDIATNLEQRLMRLFLQDPATGRRPLHGEDSKFQLDPHWQDWILFYEYFHGDTGKGLGASHQTGWTGLIAELIQRAG